MNFYLNDEQRKLVSENINVVDMVICKYIHINKNICGMEYDDIFQVGAIGLCKAAANYKKCSSAKFKTYAFQVIRNTIIDHLKSITCKQNAQNQYLSEANLHIESQKNRTPDEEYSGKIVLQALQQSKERYSGSALRGIEAIELKARGYSGADIARRYNVKSNYITACISRAKKYLRKDELFLKMIA